jgi:hypothetical protein
MHQDAAGMAAKLPTMKWAAAQGLNKYQHGPKVELGLIRVFKAEWLLLYKGLLE